MKIAISDLEPCNRCCSKDSCYIDKNTVECNYCGFKDDLEVWQLRGWRSIEKYPPTYKGIIFVYGKNVGRTIAIWDSETKTCNVIGVTHWLRTPDPTKQINM